MNKTYRALSIALCLALALAASAHAVGEGRVIGTITDPGGKPLPGIKITLTRPGTDYKQEKVTDKNGKFTILVLDATQEYVLRMEKEGYDAYEETIKPRPSDTLRLSYTLAENKPVGPSEEEARAAGHEVVVAKHQFRANSRAQILGELDGLVKIIAKKNADGTAGQILGVHMVGPWVTEQLTGGYLAVNWDATVAEVAEFIQPHPSLTELFGETVLTLTGRNFNG